MSVFESIQYTEHLKYKQGHLLRGTHSTFQIRKPIFLSGVLGNVFTQTISYSSASLHCCVSAFALKSQTIGPIPDAVTLPRALHIPKACFMSKPSTCWDCFSCYCSWVCVKWLAVLCKEPLKLRALRVQHVEYKRWWLVMH